MSKSIYSILLLFLCACSSSKVSNSNSLETLTEPILVSLGSQDQLTFMFPRGAAPSLNNNNQFLLGILKYPSHLQLKDSELMMTKISMQMAVSPESGYLSLPDEQVGKWAIVQGHWSGNLYQANILCTFDQTPSPSLLRDFEKGTKNVMDYCR